jgi:hypothetical protein
VGLVIIAVGSRKVAEFDGAVLGHIGRLLEVGLHPPPEATAGCLYICVPMTSARIIAIEALKIARGLNIEKTPHGLWIFGYEKICVNCVNN